MLFAVLALLAAPHDDPQGRFGLSLPRGWTTAALPGEPGTLVLRREADNLLANVVVRVLAIDRHATLEALASAQSRPTERQPGYRLLAAGASKLGDLAGLRRRYVHAIGEGGRWRKMCEDRIALGRGVAYLVHAESLAESFSSFEQDFEPIFASFMPGAPAAAGELLDAPVVGRWLMVAAPDTLLELRADGTFELAGAQGTFSLEGAVLRMRPFGGREERFGWRIEQGQLVLDADELGGAIRYRRAGARR